MNKKTVGYTALLVYGLSICLANWMIANVGYTFPGAAGRHFLPVGFGLMATSGTYAAALVLVARDIVQRTLGRKWGWAVIIPAAAAVALMDVNLALASGASFLFSESADYFVYTRLQARGLGFAVFASSLIGSAADSIIFLTLAQIPLSIALPGLLVGRLWVSVAAWALIALSRAAAARAVTA